MSWGPAPSRFAALRSSSRESEYCQKCKLIAFASIHTKCSGFLNPPLPRTIYADEMSLISNNHFSGLEEMLTGDNLGYKYLGNRYDSLIDGWTKYWNEVLDPNEKLDPNLVKALIAKPKYLQVSGPGMPGALCRSRIGP